MTFTRPLISLFLLLYLCIPTTASAQDKPVVYWPYFSFPPHFITTDKEPQGMGIDVARLVQQELPNYEHVFMNASPKRIEEELRKGDDLLAVTGMLKIPERESFALFSTIPCRLTFTMTIVLRPEDQMQLSFEGKTSVTSLLADPDLLFGYVPGLNYGPLADIVTNHTLDTTHRNVITAHSIGQMVELLKQRRIDWFIHDALGVWYEAQRAGKETLVTMIQAEEYPQQPIIGHVACPKTPQGSALMADINSALHRLVQSGALGEALKQWVPEEIVPTFNQAYSNFIRQPVHKAAAQK